MDGSMDDGWMDDGWMNGWNGWMDGMDGRGSWAGLARVAGWAAPP